MIIQTFSGLPPCLALITYNYDRTDSMEFEQVERGLVRNNTPIYHHSEYENNTTKVVMTADKGAYYTALPARVTRVTSG